MMNQKNYTVNKVSPFFKIIIGFLLLPLSAPQAQNLKVFILAGQSNMQGHGEIEPENINGTLSNFMMSDQSAEFSYIQNADGSWATKDNVWVRYDHENGELLADILKVGYGGYEGQIGPELGFGHLLGGYLQDQVLLIKTCWGGKNLAVDFRPPSSGGTVGPYFNQMIADINATLSNLTEEFPQYSGGQIEIAGFCWFQGWNDGEEESYLNEYEENLKNLIADVRELLGVPDLPVVIGLTGNGGFEISQSDIWVQNLQTILVPAQINAAEFTGHVNVKYAETRDFWREGDLSPEPDFIHHWNNNAESYLRIGHEMGLRMIEMIDPVALPTSTAPEVESVQVYPSPMQDYIQIETERNDFTVNVVDVNGRIVRTTKGYFLMAKIEVADLMEGIYFIEVRGVEGELIALRKVVKDY